MSPFWILILIANAFTMVGIATNKGAAFVASLMFTLAAVAALFLGGAS